MWLWNWEDPCRLPAKVNVTVLSFKELFGSTWPSPTVARCILWWQYPLSFQSALISSLDYERRGEERGRGVGDIFVIFCYIPGGAKMEVVSETQLFTLILQKTSHPIWVWMVCKISPVTSFRGSDEQRTSTNQYSVVRSENSLNVMSTTVLTKSMVITGLWWFISTKTNVIGYTIISLRLHKYKCQ